MPPLAGVQDWVVPQVAPGFHSLRRLTAFPDATEVDAHTRNQQALKAAMADRQEAAWIAVGRARRLGASPSTPVGDAGPVRLTPSLEQVGDAISGGDNYVESITLGRAPAPWFCKDSSVMRDKMDDLPETVHPAIKFRYPVKHVHVKLKDFGTLGSRVAPRFIWDALYGLQAKSGLKEIPGDMPADGGAVVSMQPLCLPAGQPGRLEFEVTGYDPAVGKAATSTAETPNHTFRELLQIQYKLLPGSRLAQQSSEVGLLSASCQPSDLRHFKGWRETTGERRRCQGYAFL